MSVISSKNEPLYHGGDFRSGVRHRHAFPEPVVGGAVGGGQLVRNQHDGIVLLNRMTCGMVTIFLAVTVVSMIKKFIDMNTAKQSALNAIQKR